jgi:TatD DNase family protein
VHEIEASALETALRDLPEIARAQRAVAIGECGLDNPKARKGGAPLELQRRVVARHLEVAKELRLPVILHCVHAHGTLLELLEHVGPLPRGGVMHSFGGAVDLLPRYLRLGLSFSFAGILSRENAQKPRTSLRAVPRDRLLVESDGPDQALRDSPTPRSEPRDILRTLGFMAELRGEPVEQLGEAVRANAEALFARA